MTTERSTLTCLATLSAPILFLSCGSTCCAQQPSLAARLNAAAALTSLEDVTRAYHLKVGVTLFHSAAQNPEEGTIERWQSGAESKTVLSIGAKSRVYLQHNGLMYYGPGESDILPWPFYQMLATYLHPGPSAAQLQGAKFEVRRHSFGKLTLDCITVFETKAGPDGASTDTPISYCVLPDNDRLELSVTGSQSVQLERQGRFEEHEVTVDASIVSSSVTLAKAHLLALGTYTPTRDEFTPPADYVKGPPAMRFETGFTAVRRLTRVTPVYPPVARVAHLSGVVVLHAIIGKDGHVHSLEPVSSPAPSLTSAAMDAVQQWTYAPYMLMGEPTEVDTTITVNFNMNELSGFTTGRIP